MSVHSQARQLRFERRYRGVWTHLDIIEAEQWTEKVDKDLDWVDKDDRAMDKNWRRKSDQTTSQD